MTEEKHTKFEEIKEILERGREARKDEVRALRDLIDSPKSYSWPAPSISCPRCGYCPMCGRSNNELNIKGPV